MKIRAQTWLRRYTNLPALIYLLRTRSITLLDPITWDDKNDTYYLKLYREKKKLKSVLAICFTQAPETYHHWHVFAGGAAGICIEFSRLQLLKAINEELEVKAKPVRYLTLNQLGVIERKATELPFLKRFGFQHENEFRIIYASKSDTLSAYDVKIPLTCIRRITLSPWLHPSLEGPLKETIKAISGCETLKIARSTLISNKRWREFGDDAT